MATPNAQETLERVSNFASDFATATLKIRNGETILAAHTLSGFTVSNEGSDGIAVANAIPHEIISSDTDQEVDNAILESGERSYVLTVDTAAEPLNPPADLRLTTKVYVNGEPSEIYSLTARVKG
jgi:hypothetical protein